MTTERRREIVRNSQAKRRAFLKANGYCVQCGRDAMTGKTICHECLIKQKLANKRYKERTRNNG